MSSTAPDPTPEPAAPSFPVVAKTFWNWLINNPAAGLLFFACLTTVVYFFGFYQVYQNGVLSVSQWAASGWTEENDQQHCFLIPPLIVFLLWYHRGKLAAAPKQPSGRGLWFVIAGVVTYVVAVRCLQPRIAIVALPLMIYGAAEFLGGRAFARVFLFPCLLILFLVPIGGIIQGTITLQLLASKMVGALCGLLGIAVQIVGTKITVDGYEFEVAGGCSGIRSLMAMTMLSALYVHFTQHETWKQWVIFAGSIFFALVGNVARLFTVVLVAKWWDPKIAGGLYHDYSGFVFFPVAVMAMVSFGNLLNRDWTGLGRRVGQKLAAPEKPAAPVEAAGERKPASPISYDY